MQELKPNRRQEQAQESRQRLMDAALEQFARNGYARTSVHALCQSLGVADSLLYHYFPRGKMELMQVIAENHLSQLIDELNSLNQLVTPLPIEEMIEVLYQRIRQAVLAHGDFFRLLLQEGEIREMLEYHRFFRLITARQQWFLNLLESRARQGEIQPIDFESAAETLDSLMLYHLFTELTGITASPLGRDQHRKRLIACQVELWKRPAAPKDIEKIDQ